MTRLPKGLRRGVALALLLAVPALAWLGVAEPVIELKRGLDSRIVEDRDLLARYRDAAGRRAALRAQRDALAGALAEGLGFLEGASAEVAAAGLQNRARAIIRAQSGALRSAQALEARPEGPYLKVGTRLALAIEIEGLQRILYDLEDDRTVLFVDNLEIRAAPAPRTPSPSGAEPPRLLDVTLDVFGYLQGEGS